MASIANIFNKKTTQTTATRAAHALKPLLRTCHYPHISFEMMGKGIDNVHVDVHLSAHFYKLTRQLIHDLLNERTSTKRRFSDKPSPPIREQLQKFANSYQSMLTAAIHRAKEGKHLEQVQLFQIAVLKLILEAVSETCEEILKTLRDSMLSEGTNKTPTALKAYERTVWITQNRPALVQQVNSEILAQLEWAERKIANLRESLLGVQWSIPLEMLLNPLLQNPDVHDHNLLMQHYVFIPESPRTPYHFAKVNALFEAVLEEIAHQCAIIETSDTRYGNLVPLPSLHAAIEVDFSWLDNTDNMRLLFDELATLDALQKSHDPEQQQQLKQRLQLQQQANKLLLLNLSRQNLVLPILAAYEVPRLHEHYAKLLKPYMLFQGLCGELDAQEVWHKLQMELKIRPLRRSGDRPLSINELVNTQKRLKKLAKKLDIALLARFTTDFSHYRRDLKLHQRLHKAIQQLQLRQVEADVQLSKSNGMLHEFLEQAEYEEDEDDIRCHVIIKADLRGSTTITSELRKRGLNPATHFSTHFFKPIRQLLADYGAEKVFIEGDAVILSLFEYQNAPAHWMAVARACGLARNMLKIVDAQNQICQQHDLPVLELGIGVCYLPEAPTFLYDGDQRIMISSAIGTADRLSSCSWTLRRKYASHPNLMTHVMVFEQPASGTFRGEKGMTTIRYNLNGVELEASAFEKLRQEIALRTLQIKLPGDALKTRFYLGRYSDARGETHDVVIREGQVRVWQDTGNEYPLTEKAYYEVVADKRLLTAIRKAMNLN